MLLRFQCENIFCFAGPCELLPIAGSDTRHQSHLTAAPRPGAPRGLRLAGIYGPNGHGKTRFIQAMEIVERFVRGFGEESLKEITPFKLKSDLRRKPSKFIFAFRISGIDYEYGLVASNEKVHQEWLFETEKRQETLLFSRQLSPKSENKYIYEFGRKLRDSKSPIRGVGMPDFLNVISSGTEPTQSFLNEAFKKDVIRIQNAYSWFAKKLQIISTDTTYKPLTKRLLNEPKFLLEISKYIKDSDTGIVELCVDKSILTDSLLNSILPDNSEQLMNDLKNLAPKMAAQITGPDGAEMTIRKVADKFEVHQLRTKHQADDGLVDFDVCDESSGTRRLMDLYPMLTIAAEEEFVFIVDELDRKLHPLLSYEFVEKFLKKTKGQLIFTTHTTHLLDLDLMRRDEIWLFQKNETGSSDIYSLNEFKIRPDLDVRKGYLQGRFGAIPFLGSANNLGSKQNAD